MVRLLYKQNLPLLPVRSHVFCWIDPLLPFPQVFLECRFAVVCKYGCFGRMVAVGTTSGDRNTGVTKVVCTCGGAFDDNTHSNTRRGEERLISWAANALGGVHTGNPRQFQGKMPRFG